MKVKAQHLALLLTLSVACVLAADWPGYYGPKRDSTSTEKGLLRSWLREGPENGSNCVPGSRQGFKA